MATATKSPVEIIRQRMRTAAEQCGMTQEEIGLRMGFGKGGARQAVSRLLGQEDYDPRLSTLISFAEAVQKPLDKLLK